jgi:hypothetical protein
MVGHWRIFFLVLSGDPLRGYLEDSEDFGVPNRVFNNADVIGQSGYNVKKFKQSTKAINSPHTFELASPLQFIIDSDQFLSVIFRSYSVDTEKRRIIQIVTWQGCHDFTVTSRGTYHVGYHVPVHHWPDSTEYPKCTAKWF